MKHPNGILLQVPFHRQASQFTCGPACLMMAMKYFQPKLPLSKGLLTSIHNQTELYEYTGRINCPFEMGSGKASFVVGSYEMPVKEIQPNKIRYLMKKTFAGFYWRTLSGNWDWLLNMYLGETYKKIVGKIAT